MTLSIEQARDYVELHKHQEEAIKKDVDFNPFHEARYLYAEAKGVVQGWDARGKADVAICRAMAEPYAGPIDSAIQSIESLSPPSEERKSKEEKKL